MSDGGDCSGAAEIKQIDHQEIGNAAQHRRVDVGDEARPWSTSDFGPGAEDADDGAGGITRQRDQDRHRRAGQQDIPPAAGAETQEFEDTGLGHNA
ncbi:hypothetical protein D3C71_1800010 [compost metagenome]